MAGGKGKDTFIAESISPAPGDAGICGCRAGRVWTAADASPAWAKQAVGAEGSLLLTAATVWQAGGALGVLLGRGTRNAAPAAEMKLAVGRRDMGNQGGNHREQVSEVWEML